jgi:hypothetical protein
VGFDAVELTVLERAILNWIGRTTFSDSLLAQIQAVSVLRREPSKDGYVAFLQVPAGTRPIDPDEILHNPLHGPNIESAALDDDGGSMLKITEYRIASLEVFSFGSTRISAELSDFQLS